MEKLFPDSEVMLNQRPTQITKEQQENYFKEVAEEIIQNEWSSSSIERIIHDLSEISSSDSGYEIAKKLEGYSSKASYEIDTEFIEFLDDFDSNRDDILRENVKDWVKAFNPKPKFDKGQKLIVKIPLFRSNKKDSIIYVTGFDKGEANYLVHEDKEHGGGYVIAYEKVENNCVNYPRP
jgi:hypothetical protein